MTAPSASVIVLNYNGRQWLGPCLDALAAQSLASPFEIIVVDNGSTDDSVAFVRQRHAHVAIVETGANVGFAAGNNAGARRALGELLVFLNNDTVPAPDWLERLCAPLLARSGFALVTSRLVFLDDPTLLDSAGDGYLRAGGAYKHGHASSSASYAESREVFGACGAAFAIRRSVFEELGGFDERFFMVYEDVDLSYRARLAGYRCWYAADALVRHAGSATLGPRSAPAVFYGQRNLEWTWIKNTPAPLLLRSAASHIVYSLAGVGYYLRTGKFGAAVRGKLAALVGLPQMLRARRQVQRNRRAASAAIEEWLDRGWLSVKRREKSAWLDLANHEH